MSKLKIRERLRSQVASPAAHMTWASKTMVGTVAKTRKFLSRRLWVWPITAVLLLSVLGWFVRGSIERTMESNLRSQLQTLLNVEEAMLRTWLVAHENNAKSVARDTNVRKLVRELLATPLEQPEKTGNQKAIAVRLAKQLGPAMSAHDYDTFMVVNRTEVIASTRQEAVGLEVPSELQNCFDRVFDGETVVIPPFASILAYVDTQGKRRAGMPLMYVLAPILDEHLQVVAVLGLQIRPEKKFTHILQLGQLGISGETYAFNRNGLLLSNSRFDDDLILLGLLPDQEGSRSILQLLIRDPGGDMTQGYRPKKRRAEMPMTRMMESATAGESGVEVAGYRDYRGVQVVGAWTWLDHYGFGIATEIDYSEAFRPLTILKRTFWGLLALLGSTSLVIFLFTLMVSRLQRQAREAAVEAKQLGQYKLEEKIGEGAMGVVYKGRHAMLRRPTAIKLLNTDKVSETSIARFEQEVQTTSHLNHPNTIAIYDYGHTPEGVFYYAMEYLDGLDLQELVDSFGPQPPERVIYILRQICGSLYEAHSMGLVHRDIKPANIMLNRRGGEGDVVKVLDFGLVKARGSESEDEPNGEAMAGTPLYMSPEAIQLPNSVDACSDMYAVGAVGYFLLTGHPVFEADNLAELCQLQISAAPIPPSSRLGRPVLADLENTLLACLEKDRSKRPQTARDLANRLDQCTPENEWTVDTADAWWGQYERGQLAPVPKATVSKDYDATIDHS